MDTMDRLQRPLADPSLVPMTAEQWIEGMRMGKKTVSEIKLGPRSIPVRVLSQEEVNSIRHKSMAETAKIGGDETDKNLFIQRLTLMAASTLAGGMPILNDKILRLLTLDELTYLYNEYIVFLESMNPALESITPEKFRELIDLLKKKIISVNELSLLQRTAICLAFVEQISSQEIPTSRQDS